MSYLLEELLEVVKKHLGTFFRSYKVKTDLETAYSSARSLKRKETRWKSKCIGSRGSS